MVGRSGLCVSARAFACWCFRVWGCVAFAGCGNFLARPAHVSACFGLGFGVGGEECFFRLTVDFSCERVLFVCVCVVCQGVVSVV